MLPSYDAFLLKYNRILGAQLLEPMQQCGCSLPLSRTHAYADAYASPLTHILLLPFTSSLFLPPSSQPTQRPCSSHSTSRRSW